MLKYGIILLVFIFQSLLDNMDQTNKEIWVNPVLKCGITPMEEPVRQLPYDKNFKATNDDLLSFCESMKKVFDHSNVTVDEANKLYDILFNSKVYRKDASYGMPYKGALQQKFTLEDYKKRTALRRLEDNKIAVYFYWVGCGTNFEYYECLIENGKLVESKQIKSWSASAPC